ncbi:MAG: 2-phospho-L-lactate transferase [Pseudomonadota bacterium]
MGTVVALSGQVGGAKLADGLRRLRGSNLAVIVNTGDDHEVFGLAFSPDIDTMLYTLGGIAAQAAGWEPAGETYVLHEMLQRLGSEHRVRVGDRSFALPLLRTEGLREQVTLSQVTLGFCKTLGIDARVLPMSNDPVRTVVVTDDGHVSYHEYLTELECEPVVKGFLYAGADEARIPDEVLEALYAPDLEAIVLCPANPYHTIQPILAVQGMRQLLRESGAPVIAVSPIVGDRALKGAAGKMMQELGHEVSARRAALEYYQLIDGCVIDSADEAAAEGIRACGIDVAVAPTIMRSEDDRIALAQVVLDLAQSVRARKQAERSV